MAAILLRQAFAKDISKSLWAMNPFLSNCKDDTAFVNDDKVNLSHVGTVPTVAKNRTTKGSATKRTDAATQYSLSELSTDPTWIQYSEELLVNYDKRASVIEEHKAALVDAMAQNILHDWAAGGDSEGSTLPTQIRTTGTARLVGVTQVGSTAPSGNRKGVAYADMLSVVKAFNKGNVPQGQRFGIITAEMLSDMMQITEFKSSDYVDRKPIIDAPDTFRWLGIQFYVRNTVTVWDNTATPVLKAVGADTVAASNAGAIFWGRDFVRAAKGAVKTFLNVDDAELYGSKLSALARYGAIGARKDCVGIINLVETASA